jgi:hypothetical protein
VYQLRDIFNTNLTRKTTTPINVHILHQHKDQVTGVETRKSDIKKRKRQLVARVNLNMKNRQIAKLAQTFLANNKPIQTLV